MFVGEQPASPFSGLILQATASSRELSNCENQPRVLSQVPLMLLPMLQDFCGCKVQAVLADGTVVELLQGTGARGSFRCTRSGPWGEGDREGTMRGTPVFQL